MLRSSIMTLALAVGRFASAANLAEALGSNQTLSTLTQLLETVPETVKSLDEAKNITILAPSNDAFAKLVAQNPEETNDEEKRKELLSSLLFYHVLNGTFNTSAFSTTPIFAKTLLDDEPFVNVTGGGQNVELVLANDTPTVYSGLKQASLVVSADIPFEGGVIHIIDTVLDIPSHVSTAALTAGLTAFDGALIQGKLLDLVNSTKDLTVFAPNNEAFGAVASAAEELSTNELASVLRYHVVRGLVAFSTSLDDMNEKEVQTLAGRTVTIRSIDGEIYVNQAKVLSADVIVGNGALHVVDSVLNPEAAELKPETSTEEPAIGFEGAKAGEVPFVSNVATTEADKEKDGEKDEKNAASFPLRLSPWIISLLVGVTALVSL